MFSALRQPRYRALAALMTVVAAICIGAGVWQVLRLEQKISANDDLRSNAHAAAAPVDTVLPVSTSPGRNAVEFRTVTATGRFDATHQVLVRNRSVNDTTGFLVLTPLRMADSTLLVVRGFIAGSGPPPASVPAAPSGQVTIMGRVHPPESKNDSYAALTGKQVESINPVQWSQRLGATVREGYVELKADQPGTAGLTAIPEPDLSNPAGGAVEPQHLAYVIQWFLFAALAIAAPFVMERYDRKHAADVPATDHLADRYGRASRVRP